MDQDERETRVADLPMEVDQRVGTERLRDGLDPSDEREVHPHQSQADEAKSADKTACCADKAKASGDTCCAKRAALIKKSDATSKGATLLVQR